MTMKTMIRLFALAALLAALPAAAQTFDWSSTGSTGIYDYPSMYKYSTTGPSVKFANFQSGTVLFRYPVTNTYGSATSTLPGWTTLHATFTDDSSNGSVTVKLFKVDKCDYTETQLCSITSSDGANSPVCDSCTFNSTDVDFANYYYYVEVTLARSATSANELIHAVALN
jgi:hypothetical protein